MAWLKKEMLSESYVQYGTLFPLLPFASLCFPFSLCFGSLCFPFLSFPFPNLKIKTFRVPTRAERVLS